jgi:hemerythrin
MAIEWQEYLSVGVPEIDLQHQQLFAKVNALLKAHERGASDEEVTRLFLFLDTYVVTHFRDEERLMQQLGFPHLPAHREQHQAFVGRIAKLKERLAGEGPTESLVTSAGMVLVGWLIEHISGMDRAIGQFVKERA